MLGGPGHGLPSFEIRETAAVVGLRCGAWFGGAPVLLNQFEESVQRSP
jgi:hypothetical protein